MVQEFQLNYSRIMRESKHENWTKIEIPDKVIII